MARFEKTISADFNDLAKYIEDEVMNRSASATLEERYRETVNGVIIEISIYERFSYMGGNRVSMQITLIGYEDKVKIVAFTSGGSQAVFFKLNTFGEEAFMDTLIDAVDNFSRR